MLSCCQKKPGKNCVSNVDQDSGSELDDVIAKVKKAWREIEDGLKQRKKLPDHLTSARVQKKFEAPFMHLKSSASLEPSQLWTTVHLFISSTFRDMNAEREYIVKTVLPELADWAEKRGVRIVETDLRWGVPHNATSVDTIETCLGELETIKKNTNDQPLFLCLLGDRYGWIPKTSEIPPEVAQRYDWVENIAITHMEILQGALRCNNKNALFCFRNPKFSSTLTDKERDVYFDKGLLERTHLDELKKRIPNHIPNRVDQIYIYDIERKPKEQDPTALELTFQSEFGLRVTNFFKAAIERLVGDRSNFKPPDKLLQENYNQSTFLEKRCTSTYGIDSWTNDLLTYIDDKLSGKHGALEYFVPTDKVMDQDDITDYDIKTMSYGENWPQCVKPDEFGWTQSPVCIVSSPGQGKTSLLCQTVKAALSSHKYHVFYHFCGMAVSDMSSSYSAILKRLIRFLANVLEEDINQLQEVIDFGNGDYPVEQVRDRLELVGKQRDKKVLLFLDGPEHIIDFGTTIHTMWWNFLPVKLPSNVLCIITASSSRHWIHKYMLLADATMLQMPDAPLDLRSTIVGKFFEDYSKKLDDEQLATLISKEGAHLPLWLKLACEELRVFGSFRQVTAKIREFPSQLEDMYTIILNRLIRENQELPVAKFLRYLAVAPAPLSDEFLPALLGDIENKQPVIPIKLAQLRLLLKPYVMFDRGDRSVVLPHHLSVVTAAGKVSFKKSGERMAAQRELGIFLCQLTGSDQLFRWSDSISELLWQSNAREELLTYLQERYAGMNVNGYNWAVLQRFRCLFPVHFSDKKMQIPLLVCVTCSHSFDFKLRGLFTNFCVICKSRIVDSSHTTTPANVCNQHYDISADKCASCGTRKPPNYAGMPWKQLRICAICNSVPSCCNLSVKQSYRRYALFPEDEDL